jgi:hypothetical protein
MDCIIALAGPPKSGKTTLGKKLAASLRVPFTSFGDYVRKEAKRRGIANASPRQLQDLGSELVERDMMSFCKAVLKDGGFIPGRGLIIDGIRHIDALATIKKLAPKQSVKLVYLESPTAQRLERGSLTAGELQEIDSHPVEADADLLKSVADLVLSTASHSDECFEVLRGWAMQHCMSATECPSNS